MGAVSSTVRILPALCLLLVVACRPAGSPDMEASHEVTYQPVAEDRPPIDAQDVVFYPKQDMPPGFEAGTSMTRVDIVPDYPSPEDPNAVLGRIQVVEMVDADVDDAVGNPVLETQRNLLVRQEAARRGANGVVFVSDQWFRGRRAEHRVFYHALYVSSAPPAHPEVDDLLEKLALPEGYRPIQRHSHDLSELPDVTFDVRLKRGHCYLLALAYPPGEIHRPRRGPDKVTPINFALDLKKPPQIPDYRVVNASYGNFARYRDNPKDGRSWHQLDGVWSRAGAGVLRCPVVKDQVGTVRFLTLFGSATSNPPPFEAGEGKAELVVYERRLPPAEMAKKTCGKCYHKYERCHPRKPLATCKELTECLPTVGMSVGACQSVWGK